MTVEITGYGFHDGELHIYATDVDDSQLQRIERNRQDDGSEREIEFIFTKEDINYLYRWLRRQKSVKLASPKKLVDAVMSTMGTITTISGKYLVRE